MDDRVLRGLAKCAQASALPQAKAVKTIAEFYSGGSQARITAVVAEVYSRDAGTNLAVIQAAVEVLAPHITELGEDQAFLLFLKGIGSR